MSRAGTISSWELRDRHRAAVQRKVERIQMYHAILDGWEKRDDADHEYLADVRKRLHSAEAQLKAMKP